MVRILKMGYYDIYSNMKDGYIVYNTHKKFHNGHTHINNFNTAKYIAYLALYKKNPKNNHLSTYLFNSLIRISDDVNYIKRIKYLMNEEKKKRS